MDAGTDDPALYSRRRTFLYKIRQGLKLRRAEYGLDTLEDVWDSAYFPGVPG